MADTAAGHQQEYMSLSTALVIYNYLNYWIGHGFPAVPSPLS